MTNPPSRPRRLTRVAVAICLIAAGLAVPGVAAFASHPEVSLAGSNFEIDTDANLKVDDAAPSIDWASVAQIPKADSASGPEDESFGTGTKEDTAVPTVVDGSIPPNKSDLLNFGVYLEKNSAGRFLHLFWHRVQEPSGTTNMDFEFNKSTTLSANGVTPERSPGDVLIQYDLAQGGVNPILFVSRWITGSNGETKADCEAANRLPCWSKKQNLTSAGDATGSINSSLIPAAESDGLSTTDPVSVRTFGEATVDFDTLSGNDPCVGFGSAYLKSRSSDSFTAALKDFIPPVALNFNDCGAIEITKTRKHAAAGPGDHPHAGVVFTVSGGGLASPIAATTGADGTACVDQLPFGTYTVTETVPAGYSADNGPATVTVTSASTCGDGNEVAATFSNTPLTDLTVSVNSQVDGGTASTIDCGAGVVSTGTNGDGSTTRLNLPPGTYTCTIVIDP